MAPSVPSRWRERLASGPIHNTAQVVAHPHTTHRQMIVEKEWYKAGLAHKAQSNASLTTRSAA